MTIAEFSQQIQKLTKENITFANCNSEGVSHAPTITIDLVLPGAIKYSGRGSNKFEAKNMAIQAALNDFCFEKVLLSKK